MKSKVVELEGDIREGDSRRLRNDMTVMVHEVGGKMRYLVMFQYGGEKDILLTLLNIVDVTSEVEEYIEVR